MNEIKQSDFIEGDELKFDDFLENQFKWNFSYSN